MYLVGEKETMAPTGADGMGVRKEITFGASVGVPSKALLFPSSPPTMPFALIEPRPGSWVSTSPNVRNLRHSEPSGSSRHFAGIDVNEDLFFEESILFLVLIPLGRFGFCEGTRRLKAGAQNFILDESP